MRRITMWLLATVAAVVLLFSYRTSTMGVAGPSGGTVFSASGNGTTTSGGSGSDPGTGGTASGGGSASSDSGSSSGGTSGGSSDGTTTGGKTYRGTVAQTRWGPIQVTITVANGKITNVSVPVYPNGNRRDQEINSYALPVLTRATIDAQSANIDTISGATVTSDGYRESLQAALDAAHLS